MKSTLLATAAALGLFALTQTALADPPNTGMVQVNLGAGWADGSVFGGSDPLDDPVVYGARTQWLFPLSKPVQVQADLFVEQIDSVLDSNAWPKTDSTMFGATAHLIHPTEHGRLGLAGSIYDVEVFSPFFGSGENGVEYGLVALEGQYFVEKWTLFAQGGWFGDMSSCDLFIGCVTDGAFLRASATYFFSPNTTLGFDGNLFWGDDEFFGTVRGGTARLEGEHKFESSRFSAFLGVAYEQEEVDVGAFSSDEETVTVDIGLRAYLDQMTLFDFSQEGPSMNTPTFHHALASEGILDFEAPP